MLTLNAVFSVIVAKWPVLAIHPLGIIAILVGGLVKPVERADLKHMRVSKLVSLK